jgi:indole-3-acetate monooxygenase
VVWIVVERRFSVSDITACGITAAHVDGSGDLAMSLGMSPSGGDDVMESARRLRPLIIEMRDEIERQRRLPSALLAAMHDARFFKMLVPQEAGGLECDPITAMRVVEETAIADGAAAWVLMLGSTYGLWAAFLSADAADEIFGAADAVVAGALRPSGRATAVDGGFIVNGRWGFASGIDNSAWWNGGCMVYDAETPRRSEAGAVETRLVFFPASDGRRIDTWDTGSLRGTGSHDYQVVDLFVPEARTLRFDASPRARGALYRLPRQALLDNAMAAIPLGLARRAIDSLIELAGDKRPLGSEMPLAERLTIQAETARAEAAYQAARAWLYQSVAESWEVAQAGGEFSVTQLALLRLARTHAVTASVEAVDRMYTAAGGTSVYTRNPLERCFRDIHTLTQHTSMNPANYEVSGRVLLGLAPDRPLYRL